MLFLEKRNFYLLFHFFQNLTSKKIIRFFIGNLTHWEIIISWLFLPRFSISGSAATFFNVFFSRVTQTKEKELSFFLFFFFSVLNLKWLNNLTRFSGLLKKSHFSFFLFLNFGIDESYEKGRGRSGKLLHHFLTSRNFVILNLYFELENFRL